jgi:hypothetical protein
LFVHLVDPSPLIEERLHNEVEPLRAALSVAVDDRERKDLRRQIRHKRRQIRRMRWFPIAW